ncbi:PEP-CTERM sorting domain-containing protein [Alkalimarinus alittae]|uniref:PEP-CTERM sorting domain-containing protein n=1 Tax=Alkalimarinus alittae TaxID=2961619 RepID=A0ABY6MXQ3_9ALTE|nr:PEP-CTERM sorting domain-containing protein [Alkalimarinus alittae]UZE94623.1 PEP-CTERM sorting domain-containing protein [Alkalimarinus alittae]
MKLRSILIGGILSVVSTATLAAPISIDSYDIQNANVSGYGNWSHSYDGIISPLAGSVANYSDGSGTLNDGVIGSNKDNTQLFSTGDNASIDLFLGTSSTLSSLSLFSFNGSSNGIPGNITGLNVTINGITEYFLTSGFGTSINRHSNPHEYIDLSGSALSGLTADVVTLSGFTTVNPFAEYYSISEIQIEGMASQVPEPGSLALLLAGVAGISASRKLKKA